MATTIDKHYATEDERRPFASNEERTPTTEYERISAYKTSGSEDEPFTDSVMLRDPRTKYTILCFVFVISIVVLITFILSIIQGVKHGSELLLLGISVICIALVELLLIFLVKRDNFPKEKLWFVFFVGFVIFIEAILTNVLLYY
eukprot:gene11837-13065_t